MSRIGKQLIRIPDKVQVSIEDGAVTAKGPLGELSVAVPSSFEIKQGEEGLELVPVKRTADTSAKWGLYRSLVANIVHGVAEGFEKRLEIQGVGYRAEMKGTDLVLHLGYSHPIEMPVPEGVKVELEGATNIVISGPDKQAVGQFAADVRNHRKPEPYKGKGIRYIGEYVRRKVGKRAAATGA